METKHILVSGRVQGVGFRAFTHSTASKHGINGWVRNLHDGRVEIIAVGSKEQLESFLNDVKTGPPIGKVLKIEENSINLDSLPDAFNIEADGSSQWSK